MRGVRDLGLDEDGDASHGNAAAGRSSRMPQSRNQSSPPPSAGGRDIAVAAQRRELPGRPFFLTRGSFRRVPGGG
jgi:hypothetical protein